MRDLEQVQWAERAATALERAWLHWRAGHGFGTGQLPPVSSYVGYSVEEPWGQPRVIFGLEAGEAERLAAMLDGHDCVGPVHAEVTWPDRRRQDTPLSQWSIYGNGASVPQQAADPDASRPGARDYAAGAGDDRVSEAQFAAAPVQLPSAPADDLSAERPTLPAALRQAAAMADLPAELPVTKAARLQDLTARPPGRRGSAATRARPARAPGSRTAEVPAAPESAPSPGSSATADSLTAPEAADRAETGDLTESSGRAEAGDLAESPGRAETDDLAESPGRAEPAESPGPDGSAEPAELSEPPARTAAPASAAEPVTRQIDQHTPWWQGTPFQQTAARVAEAAGEQAPDQAGEARLVAVSRPNRSRKSGPGAAQPGRWPAGGKAAGAD